MLRLKVGSVPKAFTFIDPDTGFPFESDTREGLISHILLYRAQNDLPPIENLPLVLENYWCRIPKLGCDCEQAPLKRTMLQYFKGGVALIQNMFYGEENMVSRPEAMRRAQVCEHCPLNVFPDKTTFVEWSDNIAVASTDGRTTGYDDILGNCEACSCVLKAKVHYKGPFNLSPEERSLITSKSPDCWQLK